MKLWLVLCESETPKLSNLRESKLTAEAEDRWAAWLAQRRHGGDAKQLRRTLEFLAPVRAQVISHAGLGRGDVVLDVGCGDGLIAFAAAEEVGPTGSVISATSPPTCCSGAGSWLQSWASVSVAASKRPPPVT